MLSTLVEPIYIDQLVFSGVKSDLQEEVKAECERALFQRFGSLTGASRCGWGDFTLLTLRMARL